MEKNLELWIAEVNARLETITKEAQAIKACVAELEAANNNAN